MATITFTRQGIKDIVETTKRAAAFKAAGKNMGVKVTTTAATQRMVHCSYLPRKVEQIV